MLAELRPALYITYREVRDQLRDWRIIFPIVGLTIFFPYLMNFTAQQALGFVRKYGANIIGERMVPFLLMIVGFFPISVSLVIALETFVGEKERGSIEPLLHTPLKDWQLYLGKLLSAIIPPLLSSFLGMLVYLVGLYRSHVPVPPVDLLILILCLTVVQAIMMVSGAVVVSTQTTSVRAANLLASFIIIPSALLIQGESIVMFWGDYQTLWWVVFGLAVLSLLLMRVGLAHFRREELLGREIDVLNLRWAWGIFMKQFRGGAHSIWEWYRRAVPGTLGQMGQPMLLVAGLVLLAVWLGEQQVSRFTFSLKDVGMINLKQNLSGMVEGWPLFSISPVLGIWWQNTRVLLLSFVLGIFSFGILGVLPTMLTLGLTGYLMGLLALNGISPWFYLVGFILPHGVIEIPAAVIACAAVLRMGAALATPNPNKTIGEVWLIVLADWAKVMAGLVVPLLLVAAAVEAWVTPRLALWLFR
ncbi:MAG TPA: stage II sporulation protein M [Anaerolineaceae bacterium]|nr:stage II sporulation protein M [Anaerolineaceae bacterium]